MSLRKRFGKWFLVACMGALAACTGQDNTGEVGSNELAIEFPNGTTGDFEIGRVTVDYSCTGVLNDFLGVNPEDSSEGTTDLEFVNTSTTTGEVFHMFHDFLGDCTFDVRAYEPDGELFCTGGPQAINVPAGPPVKINVELNCDVSQAIDTGGVDFGITDIVTMVGNFCPQLNSLELIPAIIPLVDPTSIQIPNPAFDGSQSCGGNADCVGTCGLSGNPLCDPVDNATELWVCGEDPAGGDAGAVTPPTSSCGNRCDGSDPGTLSFTCTATLADGSASLGTFEDPNNQDSDGNPNTYNGYCPLNGAGPAPAAGASLGYFVCSPAEPGVVVSITCLGGDGDEDCNKFLSTDVTCAGANPCVDNPVTCPDDGECWDPGVCTPALHPNCTPQTPLTGATCTTGGGAIGECASDGSCNATGCSTDTDCETAAGATECTDDTCVLATGLCVHDSSGNQDNLCTDNGVGGPGTCVGDVCTCTAGPPANCECTEALDCGAPTGCVGFVCDVPNGTCSSGNAPDCVTSCNGGAGVCLGGVCDEATPSSDTYALSGDFRAFNGLLPADLPNCGTPDLQFPNVPGSSMPVPSDLYPNCVAVPGVGGSLTFSDQGGGSYDIAGTLDLQFTIDAVIPSPFAQVLIVTTSSTVYTGTGLGAVADGQYLIPTPAVIPKDPFDEKLNMNAGTACTCEAIRDPDGNVAAFVPCGPTDPAVGASRCDFDGELCIKRNDGSFFPGACVTGTTICSAAAKDFEGDACGCTNELCVSGGQACEAPAPAPPGNPGCGVGFPCAVTSDCPGFASGQTCVSNACTAGATCDVLGGNPCALSTDCPLNAGGQTCQFTGDPAIGTPGTCSPVFGPAAVAFGFCGNPGQTCTGQLCDPVGTDTGAGFCGQPYGQACVGNICQAVDLTDALCPLANLQGGLNYTPLPNDPLQRSFGALLFTADPATCGLGMEMDRDQEGNGGPANASGWFVSNPPPLASDGTQFVAPVGTQK